MNAIKAQSLKLDIGIIDRQIVIKAWEGAVRGAIWIGTVFVVIATGAFVDDALVGTDLVDKVNFGAEFGANPQVAIGVDGTFVARDGVVAPQIFSQQLAIEDLFGINCGKAAGCCGR